MTASPRSQLRAVRPAGAFVVIAAPAGLAMGTAFGWVEWLVVGVAALVLLLLSLPFLFGARSYDVTFSLVRERLVAGDDLQIQVVVRNAGARAVLPGRIALAVEGNLVEFDVPLLRAGRSSAHRVVLPAVRRSLMTVGPATVVRCDPLGLFAREHAFGVVREVYVHPRTVVLPSMSAGLIRDLEGNSSGRLIDADLSFHAIREYAAGDARRHIHWASTAKAGQLMVRQYEESLRSRMTVVLDVAAGSYARAEEFELAVSCAASLGMRAVREAREISVLLVAELAHLERGRRAAIRRLPTSSPRGLLDAFCTIEPLPHATARGELCRVTQEGEPRLSIVILIVGSTIGLRELRKAALPLSGDTMVLVVVCDEHAQPRQQMLSGWTVLTVGAPHDLAGLLTARRS